MILFLSDHRRRTIVSAQVIWRTPVSATVPDVRRHLPGRFVNHLSNSKEFKDGQNGAELNITMSESPRHSVRCFHRTALPHVLLSTRAFPFKIALSARTSRLVRIRTNVYYHPTYILQDYLFSATYLNFPRLSGG